MSSGFWLGQQALVHLGVPVHPWVSRGLLPAHWLLARPSSQNEPRLAAQTPDPPRHQSTSEMSTYWGPDISENMLEQPQFD